MVHCSALSAPVCPFHAGLHVDQPLLMMTVMAACFLTCLANCWAAVCCCCAHMQEQLFHSQLSVLNERLARAQNEAQQLKSERDDMLQHIRDIDAAIRNGRGRSGLRGLRRGAMVRVPARALLLTCAIKRAPPPVWVCVAPTLFSHVVSAILKLSHQRVRSLRPHPTPPHLLARPGPTVYVIFNLLGPPPPPSSLHPPSLMPLCHPAVPCRPIKWPLSQNEVSSRSTAQCVTVCALLRACTLLSTVCV